MTLHQVNFTYMIPEYGNIEMDIDPNIDQLEKEEMAIREIEDTFPEIEDIKITNIKVI